LTVDTTKVFTVVTQFLTSDGTATGTLSEIKRFYVQGGVVIPNSYANLAGIPATDNSITDAFCTAQKAATGDTDTFATYGGLTEMGQSLTRGGVLVLSVWDDHAVNMLWLDSSYPPTASPSAPGVTRGPCSPSSGVPATIEVTNATAQVIYSNIKFGEIGSTFKEPTTTTTPTSPSSTTSIKPSTTTTPHTTSTSSVHTTSTSSVHTTSTSSVHTTSTSSVHTTSTTTTPTNGGGGGTASHWSQCAGIGYSGPTVCASPYTCTYSNPYYSQCL